MASSKMCSINSCKRTSRALCNCCQQYLCVDHLKEHEDMLNAQLTPLADEINLLSDQFNSVSLVETAFLTELDKWREEAHRVVDRYYETKKREFQELIFREREKQKAEIDRLRDQVNELMREREATQDHLNSINDSLRSLQQRINQFQLPEFTLSPLVIDEHLVRIPRKISRLNALLPLPAPYRTIKLKGPCVCVAANQNHLLVAHADKLCLLDQELIITKEIPWKQGVLGDIFWSTALTQFLLITAKVIYTLDEKTMSVGQFPLGGNKRISHWWCGTCLNDTLFLATWGRSPSIYEYSLRPSIQFVKEFRSPLTCTKDEFIHDFASSNTALVLLVATHPSKEGHLDLCSPTTFERYWSIKLGTLAGRNRIRCYWLSNEQWIVFYTDNSELLHISADGKLVKKVSYSSSPLQAVQLGNDALAVLTEESVNLHELP